jgi:hypothetical protein
MYSGMQSFIQHIPDESTMIPQLVKQIIFNIDFVENKKLPLGGLNFFNGGIVHFF